MKDPLSDSNIILVIIATLVIVFSLIFSTRPSQQELQPSIKWRDVPSPSRGALEISTRSYFSEGQTTLA